MCFDPWRDFRYWHASGYANLGAHLRAKLTPIANGDNKQVRAIGRKNRNIFFLNSGSL